MRVLLCRARSESVATAGVLHELGVEAVVAPVLAVEALPFELPDRRPDAVLATSARAVEALTDRHVLRLRPCAAFAVGTRTAEAWRRAGWDDVATAQGDGAALAHLIAAALPSPARLLYVAGRFRGPDLEAALRGAGYGVEVVETYAARPAAPWGGSVRARLRAGQIDAVLHYSVRSAVLSTEFAKRAGCEAEFARASHFCLSAAVAAALGRAGVPGARAAPRPTEDSLAQALLSTLMGR